MFYCTELILKDVIPYPSPEDYDKLSAGNSQFFSWKLKSKSVIVAQSHPALGDPMDCSPPASPIRGILQARIPKG